MEKTYTYEEMEEVRSQARKAENEVAILKGTLKFKEIQEAEREERLKEKLMLPVRIILFPVMLVVKIFKWTYNDK